MHGSKSPVWVLETELESSARTIHTLNHYTISPAFELFFTFITYLFVYKRLAKPPRQFLEWVLIALKEQFETVAELNKM